MTEEGNSPPQLPTDLRRYVATLAQCAISTTAERYPLIIHGLAWQIPGIRYRQLTAEEHPVIHRALAVSTPSMRLILRALPSISSAGTAGTARTRGSALFILPVLAACDYESSALLILPVLAVFRPPVMQYSQYSEYEMYSIHWVYTEYDVYSEHLCNSAFYTYVGTGEHGYKGSRISYFPHKSQPSFSALLF